MLQLYQFHIGLQKKDTLVIIDDSIVRGTTLKKSILKMLDRLDPKKIIIVSSAPQIRYPDCYGIDMANLESLIAFNAALELLKDHDKTSLIKEVYENCKSELELEDSKMENKVKAIYDPFTADEISDKITDLLSSHIEKRDVKIIFQTIMSVISRKGGGEYNSKPSRDHRWGSDCNIQ